MRNPVRYLGDVRTCPVCGKEFVCPVFEEWVYKREPMVGSGKSARSKRIILCSWRCLRLWDKQHEKELAERRRKRRKADP